MCQPLSMAPVTFIPELPRIRLSANTQLSPSQKCRSQGSYDLRLLRNQDREPDFGSEKTLNAYVLGNPSREYDLLPIADGLSHNHYP